MIIYELVCQKGHSFEGWFHDGKAFQEQLQQGLIQCPVCGTDKVTQRFTTGGTIRGKDDGGVSAFSKTDDPRALLRALRRIIETHFENVGPEFAKVALRMHYGIEEPRNIRGTTTQAEEKMLREEGVKFLKIPIPEKEPDEQVH